MLDVNSFPLTMCGDGQICATCGRPSTSRTAIQLTLRPDHDVSNKVTFGFHIWSFFKPPHASLPDEDDGTRMLTLVNRARFNDSEMWFCSMTCFRHMLMSIADEVELRMSDINRLSAAEIKEQELAQERHRKWKARQEKKR